MGSVKVQDTVSSPVHPNFCRFENDNELNQWAEKRKLLKPISAETNTVKSHDDIQFVNNVNNSKSPVSVKSTQTFRETVQSSQDNPSTASTKLPCSFNNEIPSISSNITDSPSIPTNVLVWGTVEKQPFKLLVDTGAAVTVVSDRFYNDILRATHGLLKQEGLDSVRTADGSSVPVTGAVSFPVFIGNCTYSCNASVVVGLAYNIVLGRDFHHENHAIIGVREEFVTFFGDNKV